MGAQRPGAMIARTDLEDQNAEGSCNCSLTYSENSILTFCPFFSIASSTEYGLGRRLRCRQRLVTCSSLIKTVEDPWSISASKVIGKASGPVYARHRQYRWGTCMADASIRGCTIVAAIGWGLPLTDADPELSESSRPSITLDWLGAIYAAGLRDIPRTAATGCGTDSFEENEAVDVEVEVVLAAVIAATPFPRARFARSASPWVRDL